MPWPSVLKVGRLWLFVLAGAGLAMVVVGWIRAGEAYVDPLLLEIGAALMLFAPLIYVERLVSGLRGEVSQLREEARVVADPYERVRETLAASPERTTAMEALVAVARAQAEADGHRREEVVMLFQTGEEGNRVFALGLMQGDPTLVEADVMVEGIRTSRSAFEQYHALQLASQVWDDLDGGARRRVIEAIDEQMGSGQGKFIGPGTDREALALKIKSRAADQF